MKSARHDVARATYTKKKTEKKSRTHMKYPASLGLSRDNRIPAKNPVFDYRGSRNLSCVDHLVDWLG